MDVVSIDLRHEGLSGAISAYLLVGDEPAVVDPGPSTTLPRLEEGLREAGVAPAELRHLFLTHVHLDHAGAAGHLAAAYPGLTVHVHEDGARHLADPERLVASTRRTFGEAHDRLWGEVRPVPRSRLRGWRSGDELPLDPLRALPTPGHIDHHLAYLDEEEGLLFAGDALGIILDPGAPTHPPTPPPAVDVEAWRGTLDELGTVGPERAGVAHFGIHDDVPGRILQLENALEALETRVRDALARGDEADAEQYEEEVRERLAPAVGRERVDRYFETFAAATDWAGMKHYLERT